MNQVIKRVLFLNSQVLLKLVENVYKNCTDDILYETLLILQLLSSLEIVGSSSAHTDKFLYFLLILHHMHIITIFKLLKKYGNTFLIWILSKEFSNALKVSINSKAF